MTNTKSPYADPTCPLCHGKGMERERGRHYGDAATWTKCDCYDQAAAARDDERWRAKEAADRAEADDLMGPYREAQEAALRTALKSLNQAAYDAISAGKAATNDELATLRQICRMSDDLVDANAQGVKI